MTFEEWWNISGGGVIHKDPKDAARDAWQEGGRVGFREGMLDSQERILDLQDFIAIGMSADARDVANAQRFMQEFDICAECRSVYGKHKMDCGRQR
jgi:hypothetical protein